MSTVMVDWNKNDILREYVDLNNDLVSKSRVPTSLHEAHLFSPFSQSPLLVPNILHLGPEERVEVVRVQRFLASNGAICNRILFTAFRPRQNQLPIEVDNLIIQPLSRS